MKVVTLPTFVVITTKISNNLASRCGMCGINLIIDKTRRLKPDHIEDMNRAIIHRGPDANDFCRIDFPDAHIFLGNTRLKILDLSDKSNQPMHAQNGQYILSYNGIIYNYRKLKKELLANGFEFVTDSDTEVLLNWLIWQGESGLSRLDGMFSFIFIDIARNRIICARDPVGMKPMYYYEDSQYFIASSEISGILGSGLVKKNLNEDQICHYLNFRYASAPFTFFKEIFELLPGQVLVFDHGHKTFSSLNPQVDDGGENHGAADPQAIEGLLVQSIETHLYSDVPIGLFLSGGIDSTLIMALIKSHFDTSVQSFSVNHKNDKSFGTRDGYYARKASEQFGSDHYQLDIDVTVLESFFSYVDQMDQPIGDSAGMLTYFLSDFASNHVKVALSGAGADEWFAGYHRHWAYLYYLNHPWVFKRLLPFIRTITGVLPTGMNVPGRKRLQLLRKFSSGLDRDPMETIHNFVSFNVCEEAGFFKDLLKQEMSKTDYLNLALEFDRTNYLVYDVLALSDRLTMRHGLELRMPFLSKEIRQAVYPNSADFLLKHGRKWVLKEILNRYQGMPYVSRAKEGFGLPFGQWIRNENVQPYFEFLNHQKSIIFDYTERAEILNLYRAHLKGKADNSLLLWSIMVLHHWIERNF